MKRFQKTTLALLALLVVTTLFLGGCGGDSNNKNEPPSQENKGETDEQGSTLEDSDSTELNKDAELRFTFWGSTYEKQTVESVIEAFTESTGIGVTPMHIPADYDTKITTMLAANEPPDAGYLQATVAYDWYKEGKLLNIMDLVKDDPSFLLEDFLDTVFVTADSDDEIFAMLSAIESIGLYFNKEMFEAAEVELPPTSNEEAWGWDEFLDAAKSLTLDSAGRNAHEADFDSGNIVQYGAHIPTTGFMLEGIMTRNGGGFIREENPDELSLFEPESIEALQLVSDLINVHHVAPSPTDTQNLPSPSISLQSKKYAMVVDGQWALNDFALIEDFTVGVGVLPKLKNTTTATTSGLTVVFDTPHPKETLELIKWMSIPENGLTLYKDGLWMPTRKAYYEDPEKLELWAAESPARPAGYKGSFIDPVLTDSVLSVEVKIKNFTELQNTLTSALDEAWLGKKSIQQVMEEVRPKIDEIFIGRFNK